MIRVSKFRMTGDGVQDPRSGHSTSFLSVDDAPMGFYPNMAHRTDKIDIALDPAMLLMHVKAYARRDDAWHQVGETVSISLTMCYDIHIVDLPPFPWDETSPRAKEPAGPGPKRAA